MSKKFMSVTEAAKFLSVSPRSVRRWAAEGILRAVRIGRNYRFDPQVVEQARIRGLKL